MSQHFPKQKKLSANKSKAWRKEHLDWAEDLMLREDNPIRISLNNKISNYRLYNGYANKQDYKIILNPGELHDFYTPDNIQHYPIARPYLNVLIGEEWDRRFEWKAIITNPNAISSIEEQKRDFLRNSISELVVKSGVPEEEVQQEFKNLLYYLKYEYQDLREKRANLLLKHFIKELELKRKFNEGFKNVLICSEELYLAEVINNRPVIEVLDPKKVFVIQSGRSSRVEDADIILMYDYIPRGKVLDTYHEFLKESEVKFLDEENSKRYSSREDNLDNDEFGINIARQELLNEFIDLPDFALGLDKTQENNFTALTDGYGNVRRIRLFWKSYKQIKQIKYYDELGNPQYRIGTELDKANKTLGEEEKIMWVTEWWEGVKIMDNIYPFIRPRQIQYNKFSDPSYNHPGIVGQIYNTGEMKATSLMDVAKPYQLLYDAIMHKLTDALSKFFGSLPVIDKAMLPKGYDFSKWLYFAKKAGIAIYDSFNEGSKGAATGKLAGSVGGNTAKVIDQRLGDFIQQQINLLNYIELQLGRIIGVSPQRLGDIASNETVGGVERAVTQSAFSTNELFKIHDNVKGRVLQLLLETSKVAMKNNPQKFQHIGDDYLAQIFSIDDDFIEEEYGIVIDNENDLTKLEQVFEQLAHAAIQNQSLKFGDIMKFFTTSSMAEKQRIIEQGEEEMLQRAEQANMQQQELLKQQQQMQAEAQARQEAIDMQKHKDEILLKKYTVDQQELTKRLNLDIANNNLEVNKLKIDLDLENQEKELLLSMKELDEKIRNNKAKEAIDRIKANKTKTSSSVS